MIGHGVCLEAMKYFQLCFVQPVFFSFYDGVGHTRFMCVQKVTAATLVDGFGNIKKITGEDLKAVRINIGFLGVVTDVTVKIVPNFKAKMEISGHDEDILFSDTATEMARQADYMEYLWFPTVRRVIALNVTYVDISTPGKETWMTTYCAHLDRCFKYAMTTNLGTTRSPVHSNVARKSIIFPRLPTRLCLLLCNQIAIKQSGLLVVRYNIHKADTLWFFTFRY